MSPSATSGSILARAASHALRHGGAVLGVLVVVAGAATSGQEAPAQPARADLGPARELVRAGKLDEADRVLADLQQSHPDDPALLLLRGEVLNSAGRPADAVAPLRRAAELAPQKTRIQFNLGAALAATGDPTGALEAFGKEIEVNSDAKIQALAHLNRSILFQKEKKLVEAAAEIEEVLKLDPERRDAYGDLIDLYVDAGKLEDAASAAQRSIEAGGGSARSCYRIAAAYFNQKAPDKAVDFFQKAIELQPELAQAELGVARALDELDKRAEADPHYRKYLELRPDAPEAAEVRKRLSPPPKKK